MNMMAFNVQDGYLEGLVRGLRSGLLSHREYHNLCQCANMDDVKLNLRETDYGDFLQNQAGKLFPATIQEHCISRLAEQFDYIRGEAGGQLARFLDYITYEYMISNVVLLIKGSLNNRDVNEMIARCHPLGRFKESTMRSVVAFEATPAGYAALYATVLIDTPVAPYFSDFLEGHLERLTELSEVRNVFEEVEIEIMRNTLMKYYYEDFSRFCVDEIGGDTGAEMGKILAFQADRAAILITLNSFGTQLNQHNMRKTDRKALYPSIGTLYPEGTERLSDVGDEGSLGNCIETYAPFYRRVWSQYSGGEMSIDDAFNLMEVQINQLAFDGQFHYACFYALFKLKEQEIRNIVFICECIMQNNRSHINKYIPIFGDQ